MRLDHLLSKEKVGVVLLSGFQNSPEETGGAPAEEPDRPNQRLYDAD